MLAPRYRFGPFVLSPARRLLLREGREIPLIPRYFDLLVMLVSRRAEAVSRQEIFDHVWNDVVVSDGALTQAVRALRRALGDDAKEPVYLRTMSRHGYRFVFDGLIEEADDAPMPSPLSPRAVTQAVTSPSSATTVDPFESALDHLMAPGGGEGQREAAEQLHGLGTAEALRRMELRQGDTAAARAFLRDARWDVAGAGPVPLFGAPHGGRAFATLAAMRLRRAARQAAARWAAAAAGGAGAGAIAGVVGGIVLWRAPGSSAPPGLIAGLAVVGSIIGALGAAGVGAGLAAAEAMARSFRAVALTGGGALGGATIGYLCHMLGAQTLTPIFGGDLSAVGGGVEGLVIGAATGLGYALATPRPGGGMATPRGLARIRAAAIAGATCAAGAALLAWAGGALGADSLDIMARSYTGSKVGLTPLARLLGEADTGPITRTALSLWEGFFFGAGLTMGLTRRGPRTSG